MRDLSTTLDTQIAAEEGGWCELLDVYLLRSITGPFGTTDKLRITTNPAGLSFFTPDQAPEPTATQGDAASYLYWNVRREPIRSGARERNDKLTLTASNVSGEWATMLSTVPWYDTAIVIRKVPLGVSGLTVEDGAVIFIGRVDSAVITLEQIQLTVSNDLGSLTTLAPRENMHTNCRFSWADDQCTALRWLPAHYKAMTCGSGSTVTKVKSSDLTQDTAANRYTAQSVTADATTDKITLTAHNLNDGDEVKFGGTTVPGGLTAGTWYYVVSKATNDFKVALTFGGSAIDLTSNGTAVTMTSRDLYGPDLVTGLSSGAITASSESAGYSAQAVTVDATNNTIVLAGHKISVGDAIYLTGTSAPGGLSFNTTYYAYGISSGAFHLKAVRGDRNYINITSAGTGVLLTTGAFGAATGVYNAHQVRRGQPSYWKFATAADWGTLDNGYYQIPDAQAGLANAELKPYIQFDFGSAKQPKVWRVSVPSEARLEDRLRLIQFYSSSNASSWTHEMNYEMPNEGGRFFEVLIPTASSARYWRICVRSRWGDTLSYSMFDKVTAHELARHWWASGRLVFGSAIPTEDLRNVARTVLESYAGEVVVPELPVAPASGDTFVIERGCPRTFNACCERRNEENYGGFVDLPRQGVIR